MFKAKSRRNYEEVNCKSCEVKYYIHYDDKTELALTKSDYYCEHCMNDLGLFVYDKCDRCKRLALFNKEDIIYCTYNMKQKLCNACIEYTYDYSNKMSGFSYIDEDDIYHDEYYVLIDHLEKEEKEQEKFDDEPFYNQNEIRFLSLLEGMNQKYGPINEELRGTLTRGSKQQAYLANLFGGVQNIWIVRYPVDIFLRDENIVIEYDGKGHWVKVYSGEMTMEEKIRKDLIRDKVLQKAGFKVIRIDSKEDLLPPDDVLLEELGKAKEYFRKGGSFYKIVINENNYKNLRKIRSRKPNKNNDKEAG